MREIYLDNSATTRVYPEAADAAYRVMTEVYGNPSSLHKKGIEAEQVMTKARGKIAAALGADADGLVFTSGGTEANNLAVIGTALAKRRRGSEIVASAYEHDSVMESLKYLESEGFSVTYLRPDASGIITPEIVTGAVGEKTILVTVMLMNNEIGAVNPIREIAAAAKEKNPEVTVHTDAVQAFCKLPFRADKLGADLVTITAHKIGGPKGCGALWMRKGCRVAARNLGGEQEKRIRAGTEAVPLIAAFGAAAEKAKADMPRLRASAEEFERRLFEDLQEIPGVLRNSPEDAFPGIINLSVPGIRSEIMLHFLEEKGIYLSSGSACAKGAKSHVLRAMGLPPERVDSALRISYGRENTPEDADALTEAVREAVQRLCR
ncbi:MAG TPA: cysteine desulfurase family protein [Oscillospiraceae bacterium]|nr:cysteine desulfurase family protein [Oscillospiraceae bacterium]